MGKCKTTAHVRSSIIIPISTPDLGRNTLPSEKKLRLVCDVSIYQNGFFSAAIVEKSFVAEDGSYWENTRSPGWSSFRPGTTLGRCGTSSTRTDPLVGIRTSRWRAIAIEEGKLPFSELFAATDAGTRAGTDEAGSDDSGESTRARTHDAYRGRPSFRPTCSAGCALQSDGSW